ncbi:hypothetical protein MVEN_00689600 [Mycena venus]|uniref:Uncharacterized protein n=1 Tax=Mycena venus TaxID=2733690 RepID=A0A8H6YEH9_9AGAR|nr:hypothetical protein MVEN_00689600 [Mycena venus]
MSLTDVTCNILVRGADGTEYGYISPVLNADGFYAKFQPAKAGALAVSFSYSATACSRLNLHVHLERHFCTIELTFLFVLGNSRSALRRSGYTSIPLGLTCTTPPSGAPRVFSEENSNSALASADKRESRYLESSIWRYNPATQALTAQWINPEGDEPETTIILAEHSLYYPRRRLALAGDVDRMREEFEEDASVAVVTFTCVPILPDITCNILVRGANGTKHGYISPVLNADGFYANFQSAQAGAPRCVILILGNRVQSAQLAGIKRPQRFPIPRWHVGNERLVLCRNNDTDVPLGLTCATPPSGTPRVFSEENSHSAVGPAGKREPWYLESSIWRYNPATKTLTAQWINPQKDDEQWINPQNVDEPETTIILIEDSLYNTRRRLALTGDVDRLRELAREDNGSVAVVTFTCVPTQIGSV